MENKVTKKSWPPYLILGLISLAAALILAITNAVTAGPIAEHKMAALKETFGTVMPAASYEEVTLKSSKYSNVSSIYAAKDESGSIIGYCVTASQQGYAGPVAVTFGMDPSGNVVATKVGDTDFQETTGIGSRALNPEFAEQFTGLNAIEGGAFEAISGATFTSKAILGDVNGAFGAMAETVLDAQGGEVVFGKREVSTASAADPSELVPGATLKGQAQGFAGPVTVTIELDDNANIGSLSVDVPDETEGLGKRAAESSFTDQFIGMSIPVSLESIDALSGATITTTAVVDAINSAAPAAAEILPGATLEGSAQGFAGTVSVKVKLDDSLLIESLTVKAPDETEGLGKRAEEAAFTDQFAGKSIPVSLEEIDAVAGATITSTAVVDAINSAVPVEAEGALTVEELSSIAEGSVGLQSNGLAVVNADSSYSGTLVGEFVYENGQLVSAAIATPAPAVQEEAEPEDDSEKLTLAKPAFGDQDIVVSLTLAEDSTVASLTVDASTQTPGLGQLCAEEAFTSQFIGKSAPFVLGEDIDAVAGATITSTAVVDAVNELTAVPGGAESEEDVLTVSKPAFSDLPVTVSLTAADDGTVASLTVDASTQTPGLGQLCAEEAFTSQFIGKSGPFVLGENIDAASGATITSTAVVDAVNELLPAAPAEETAEEPVQEAAEDTAAALTVSKPAFGDQPVTVTLTANDDGTVASLTVDASTQTPGLGQLCAEEAFTSQFVGKAGPFVLGENIDAASGATITSTAVVDAVNELLPAAPAEEVAEEPAQETAEETAEALTVSKPAFSDLPVTVILTANDDGTVASLTVDASTQTPGLGQLCAEEAFTSQFIGKSGPFVLGENIDAASGATITSTAVVDAVNELLPAAPAQEAAEETAEEAAEEPAQEAAEETAAALTVSKPAFSDLPVTVTLTANDDGTVASLTVDASTQTPGLGQLCAEEAFTSQFIGKSGPFVLGENIDAASGATITSTAVVDAVNELLPAAPAQEVAEETAEEPVQEAAEETAAALTVSKPGFGDQPVTVTLTANDGTVASLTVDASTQTPGLGQLCAEEAFTSQFVGKAGPFVLGENIDAASGATITSTAVVDAVNELLPAAPAEETAEEPAQETAEETAAALTVSKPAFGDQPVTVTLTANDDGTVASLTVDASTQTPGLGQLCAEEAFTSQFVGKAGPFVLGENIDAASGATITSTAVVDAVNELLPAAPAEQPAEEVPAEEPAAEEAAQEEAAPEDLGEVYSLTTPGFGELAVTVSLTKAEEGTVTSLVVDASAQTAGIGTKCEDESFTSQFVGKTGPFVLGENVDAASGATITSTAVVKAVNELLGTLPPAEEPAEEVAAEEPAAEEPAAEEAAPEDLGEVYSLTTPGFGELAVTVSLTKTEDGTVTSLVVDASAQTAGIGTKCEDESFTSQFVGKTGPFILGENIDAASGATITSTAVVKAVNELLGTLPPVEEIPAEEPAAEEVPAEEPAAEETPVEEPAAEQSAEEVPAEEALTLSKAAFGEAEITVALTLAEDGTVASLTVDAASQTAGLGQLCAEEAFTSQFIGKAAPFVLGENIDAVAGATITSTAVVDAVNELLSAGETAEEVPAEEPEEEPAEEKEPEKAAVPEIADDGTMTLTVPGFGQLPVVVSLKKAEDGTVAELSVDVSAQTAGIGQKCADAGFISQFVGKAGPFVLGENVDAVSGATITSTAIVDAVNDLLAYTAEN